MNTIVTFGTMAIALGVLLLVGGLSENTGLFAVILGAVGVVMSALFFPLSKTLWSAIDLCMIELDRSELHTIDRRLTVGTEARDK